MSIASKIASSSVVAGLTPTAANTVLASADGSTTSWIDLTNAYIAADAAIYGTKISPDFGNQIIISGQHIALGGTSTTAGEVRLPYPTSIGVEDNVGDPHQLISFGISGTNTLSLGLISFPTEVAGNAITVNSNTLQFGSSYLSTITQAALSGGTGKDLTVKAQTTTDVAQNGGNLILSSGAGGAGGSAGVIKVQSDTTQVLEVGNEYLSLGNGTVASTGNFRTESIFTLYGATSGGGDAKLFDWGSETTDAITLGDGYDALDVGTSVTTYVPLDINPNLDTISTSGDVNTEHGFSMYGATSGGGEAKLIDWGVTTADTLELGAGGAGLEIDTEVISYLPIAINDTLAAVANAGSLRTEHGFTLLAQDSTGVGGNNASVLDFGNTTSDTLYVGDSAYATYLTGSNVFVGPTAQLQVAPAAITSFVASLRFGTAIISPIISQATDTTGGITADALTIQAQNATGTTSIGGDLILTSGTGTSEDGYVKIQGGGTTVLQSMVGGVEIPRTDIGELLSVGLAITNSTAATSGVDQYSPAIRQSASVWDGFSSAVVDVDYYERTKGVDFGGGLVLAAHEWFVDVGDGYAEALQFLSDGVNISAQFFPEQVAEAKIIFAPITAAGSRNAGNLIFEAQNAFDGDGGGFEFNLGSLGGGGVVDGYFEVYNGNGNRVLRLNEKPTVTGSKGANAALQSLLEVLANLDLIIDSTT